MYNYREAIKEDVKNYIIESGEFDRDELIYNRDSIEERLNDDLWIEDSVTGNASGSYTFNRLQAREYVLDNMDLLQEMAEAFGQVEEAGKKIMSNDWEWCDVSIRCYLLGEVIGSVLDEISEEIESEVM